MASQRISPSPILRSRGFTLIELMVVLAILAIVAAVAVPSYQSSIESNQRTSAANNLLGALQFARSEAVIQRTEVKVCASTNGTSCSGNDWSTGGVVLKTSDNAVLRSIPSATKVQISGDAITFNSDGSAGASSISVGSSPSKSVTVNIVGHAKIN